MNKLKKTYIGYIPNNEDKVKVLFCGAHEIKRNMYEELTSIKEVLNRHNEHTVLRIVVKDLRVTADIKDGVQVPKGKRSFIYNSIFPAQDTCIKDRISSHKDCDQTLVCDIGIKATGLL